MRYRSSFEVNASSTFSCFYDYEVIINQISNTVFNQVKVLFEVCDCLQSSFPDKFFLSLKQFLELYALMAIFENQNEILMLLV